ncbi:MAG: hypothetical protein WBV73_01825, partial [Phormidium sp.]
MEVQPREIQRYVTPDGRVPLCLSSVGEIKALKSKILAKLRSIGEIMKNVKTPASDSYYDYLISSLKDPEESAMYIEVTLEEGDSKLLNLAIGNVVAAHQKMNNLSEEAKLHYQNLSQMLLNHENSEIYTLV